MQRNVKVSAGEVARERLVRLCPRREDGAAAVVHGLDPDLRKVTSHVGNGGLSYCLHRRAELEDGRNAVLLHDAVAIAVNPACVGKGLLCSGQVKLDWALLLIEPGEWGDA